MGTPCDPKQTTVCVKQCDVISMCGCQWKEFCSVYRWCDCWLETQGELWSTRKSLNRDIFSDTDRTCFFKLLCFIPASCWLLQQTSDIISSYLSLSNTVTKHNVIFINDYITCFCSSLWSWKYVSIVYLGDNGEVRHVVLIVHLNCQRNVQYCYSSSLTFCAILVFVIKCVCCEKP